MGEQQVKTDPIRVPDADRPVVLHPENDDLFVRTGRQVISACQLGISLELWLRELDLMIEDVRGWAEAHAGHVRACYCAARGARVVLFFVPATEQFDFDLADALAELNSRLVREFNIGIVEVGQVPADELARFLDVESARQVYGEPRRPPSAVEA